MGCAGGRGREYGIVPSKPSGDKIEDLTGPNTGEPRTVTPADTSAKGAGPGRKNKKNQRSW